MNTVTENIRAAKLLHWSTDVKVGDVLKYWSEGSDKVGFARVLKVCPRMLKVRGEHGEIGYKRPGWFVGRVPAATAAEMDV